MQNMLSNWNHNFRKLLMFKISINNSYIYIRVGRILQADTQNKTSDQHSAILKAAEKCVSDAAPQKLKKNTATRNLVEISYQFVTL